MSGSGRSLGGAVQAGELVDDRYEVVRLIGRGAMAAVYEALDRRALRPVALKILNRSLMRDDEAIQRFRREARVQEMVHHRNVAKLYGGGVTERGQPYLVVELLRGRSLYSVLKKENRVDVVRASSYCWQALKGLAACHAVGVFHRDLKPANMMLEPSEGPIERVVLIDFGFAALEGASKLTAQGHVVGSLSYLSPERLRGDGGDERSDLYAMGVVFYELLVGKPPFEHDDDYALMHMHLEIPPTLPSVAAPDLDIPPTVEAVIMRALAKKPGDRYPSAAHMAYAVEQATLGIG